MENNERSWSMETVYLVIKMVVTGMVAPVLFMAFVMGYSVYYGQMNKSNLIMANAQQEVGKVKQAYQMIVQKSDAMANELYAIDNEEVKKIMAKYITKRENPNAKPQTK